MAAFRGISHCYQRPTYEDWPYSVFTMAHGRSKEECDAVLDSIAEECGMGPDDRATLYSSTEYKKIRLHYFTAGLPRMGGSAFLASGARDRLGRLYERALRVLPGGVNSPVRAMRQIGRDPIFIERAKGCELVDVDGNRYLDWVGSWGPLILGHADPAVVAAVIEAAERGTSYGAATEAEVELAEEVVARVPSVEMVRMTSSGTEAAMSAVRLARAVTGREVVVKFAGAYHGHSDGLLAEAGSGLATLGIPGSPGVTAAQTAATVVVPWNDREAVDAGARRARGRRRSWPSRSPPTWASCRPPSGFLEFLREATRERRRPAVFDEVITGFRVARGGAQELYGVEPDLTVLGKVLGGGLPAAAFGGPRETMERIAPAGDVYQAGTLSGNPLAVAAGLATLRRARRRRLRAPRRRSPTASPPACASSPPSGRCRSPPRPGLLTLFFSRARSPTSPPPRPATSRPTPASAAAMLARGVYPPPPQFEAWFVSLAHDEASDRPHPRGGRRVARGGARLTMSAASRTTLSRPTRCAPRSCARRGRRSRRTSSTRGSARLGVIAAAGPRAAAAPGEYAFVVEAVREGYLLHYGEPRLLAGHDDDLALLAGDYLYALGIDRLAALGDTAAVAVLARSDRPLRPAPRRGPLGEVEPLWTAGRPRGRGGHGEPPRAVEAIDFAATLKLTVAADDADKLNGAEEALGRSGPAPDPPGYFEGESMTRRKALTVGVAGHRRPRRRRDRPARGRLRDRADLPPRQGALGGGRPGLRLRRRHLPPGRLHRNRGDRRRRQDDRLHPQKLQGTRRGTRQIRRRLQPLRAPRLPGPLRRGRRQLHLPLPRRRLRLPGQADRRPAGAPARPLPDPRPRRPGRGRPALQRHQPARTRSAPATPASSPAESGNTSTRRGPLPSRPHDANRRSSTPLIPAPLRKPAKPGEATACPTGRLRRI